MKKKTRGETEAEFTKAMIQFEKEYLGRGPLEAHTIFLNDMIIVRLKGVLTRAENKLSESLEGRELVKETRRKLFESARSIIAELVESITQCQLISLHTDVSTKTGERVVVLVVDCNFEERFTANSHK